MILHRNSGAISRCIRIGILIAAFAVMSHSQTDVPLVVLIGPPGSGKTTQTEILRKERGMAVISVDDLIVRNRQAFEKFKNPNIHGIEPRVDPVLNRLVDEALSTTNVTKGVILDGYPAAKIHGDYLATLRQKYHIRNALVIHLRVPDDVVIKRLKGRNRAELDQQLKDYHREFDFAREYFPEADIRDIDGTMKPRAVAAEIRKLLTQLDKQF